MSNENAFLDPLYGESTLSAAADNLARQPVMQRLRHVRLSNIDSVGMPGIANVSRYEHCVGTALLAARVGFRKQLSRSEDEALQAAALLHDSAIPPFGHLIEEAFAYVSAGVNHESRWSLVFANPGEQEIGGLNLQIFLGRQSGLWDWAQRTFKGRAEASLKEILSTIKGKGKFGKCICGDLDLDNLDNVVRAAFHMGVDVDKSLPQRIAEAMVDVDPVKGVVFRKTAIPLVREWLDVRKHIYSRFMLSRPDFVGKLMLIFATVQACKRDLFSPLDWKLTDSAFIERLLRAQERGISEAISSWLCAELWPLSELVWMAGKVPPYELVYQFSEAFSQALNRTCLAYVIKDKRSRLLRVAVEDGGEVELGAPTSQWLLGVCSPLRKNFSDAENRLIVERACEFFSTRCLGRADPWGTSDLGNISLFP